MKKLTWILCSLGLWAFSHTALAYEQPTHERMSKEAALASVLNKLEALSELGLNGKIDDNGIDDENLNFPNSNGSPRNIIQLFSDGANFEDHNIRPLNHFFDPTSDAGLALTSPTWALEDKGQISLLQSYSYADARHYFHDALTKTDKAGREKNFGLLFESLGRVIHHLQDMTQPQHVRADTHLNLEQFFGNTEMSFEDRSRYEKYTLDKYAENRTDIPKPLSLPTGYGLVYTSADTATFTTPRKFWSTTTGNGNGGKGIAEYTNRGFFSADTNMGRGKYASPTIDPTAGTEMNIGVLCDELAANKNPCPPALDALRGSTITFFSNKVVDTLRPDKTDVNQRATTSSIFDQDLKEANEPPVYALNRFNFDAAHEFLIPRAVAYSAGLIDYFFRGKIDLIPNPGSPGSYVIKNLGNEEMNGIFALYYDDVDGARHEVPGASWNLRIAKNGQSTPLVFYPPASPAPATSGEYMLVFKGDMGEETAGNKFVGAITGKMVRAQPSTSGFTFQRSDWLSGTHLIYRDNGQWVLSKEAGLAAGNIDWKGWYVNGKPTKVITWKGPASRYLPPSDDTPGNFSREIYQDGKLFSVAPALVLGAALTKDAFGNEWLIAICKTAGGDTVYRRPNTANTAPGLYDPVQAPEGWQLVATFADPQNTLHADRAWLFNGNGTEAQTMRCTQDFESRPWTCRGLTLTRLKITVSGASARMDNVGNSVITTTESSESNAQNCEGDGSHRRPYPTVYGKYEETITGATVVAVDYHDNREILARMSFNRNYSSAWKGERIDDGSYANATSDDAYSTTLSFDEVEITLSKRQSSSNASDTDTNGYTHVNSASTEQTQVLFLDLRENVAIYWKSFGLGHYTSADSPEMGGPGTWNNTWEKQTQYQLQHGTSIQTFYDFSDKGTDSASFIYDRARGFMSNCFDNYAANESSGDTTTREFGVSFLISGKDVSAAIDRDDNLFVSMKYLDEEKLERHFNFLTGGDPVAITGIIKINPYTHMFDRIAPK